MRGWMNKAGAACALALGLTLPSAVVAAAAGTERAMRTELYTEHHVVAEDGSEVSTYRIVMRLKGAEAIDNVRKADFRHSAGTQRFELVGAFTLKADGRKIKVPQSNVQQRAATTTPLFSDLMETTLVFPDLQVGDAAEVTYRIATKQPLFPGKFSHHKEFSRAFAIDLASITVDAPAGMKLKSANWHMDFSESKVGKRQVLRWTLRNPQPISNDRREFSAYEWGSEPAYAVSSFESVREIAQRYVERATPKAVVTPHLQALADKITQDVQGERDKVKALHDWVSREIGHAGNCLDVGSTVPHELALVIDNRVGDCKDRGVLFQALLQAKGIASHQVLLNGNNLYEAPAVPVLGMVPNVITYVPSLGVFLDPTDPDMPFGLLPRQMQDKPVFAAVDGIPARTPPDDGRSSQSLLTRMEIGADGAMKGTVALRAQGRFGQRMRLELKKLSNDQFASAIKDHFGRIGLQGEGVLTSSDPGRRSDEFETLVAFATQPMLRPDKAGAFGVGPVFPGIAPVGYYLSNLNEPVRDHPTGCSSSHSEERYEITLPERMQLLSIPEGVAIDGPIITYESEYRLDGRVLHVRRSITDRMPANVCSSAFMAEYMAALKPVLGDLRQQVLYK